KAKVLASRRQAHEKPSLETVLQDNQQVSAAAETTQDVRRVLDEELQRLPEKYRAAVVLCYFEGKTFDEAARLLGCQASAVGVRLFRARDALRDRLARRGVAVPAGALAALMAQESAAMALPVTLVTPVVEAVKLIAGGRTAAGVASPAAV